jgi:predicted RNA-binding Zn ribbon-like protein
MSLPSWVSPEEDKPAPMPLLQVQAFVNTRDADRGTDLLLHIDSATAWMQDAGLIGPNTTVGPTDLGLARDIRESIRALLDSNSGGPGPSADDLRPLQNFAASHAARVSVDRSGQLHLGPLPPGSVEDGVLALLLVVRDAQKTGTWPRLKICGNPDCRWAFFDRSHSRRGVWCEMASCGNLIKNRNLRARRR